MFANAKVRGRRKVLAIKAPHVAAELFLVEMVVPGTRGQYQLVRNDVEVDRTERRLLNDSARRVVEESDVVVAHIRIVRRHAGERLDIVETIVVERRRTGGNRLVK